MAQVNLFYFFQALKNINSVFKKRVDLAIVSRGDWLGNPANFKGGTLCSDFRVITCSRPCTHTQSKMAY